MAIISHSHAAYVLLNYPDPSWTKVIADLIDKYADFIVGNNSDLFGGMLSYFEEEDKNAILSQLTKLTKDQVDKINKYYYAFMDENLALLKTEIWEDGATNPLKKLYGDDFNIIADKDYFSRVLLVMTVKIHVWGTALYKKSMSEAGNELSRLSVEKTADTFTAELEGIIQEFIKKGASVKGVLLGGVPEPPAPESSPSKQFAENYFTCVSYDPTKTLAEAIEAITKQNKCMLDVRTLSKITGHNHPDISARVTEEYAKRGQDRVAPSNKEAFNKFLKSKGFVYDKFTFSVLPKKEYEELENQRLAMLDGLYKAAEAAEVAAAEEEAKREEEKKRAEAEKASGRATPSPPQDKINQFRSLPIADVGKTVDYRNSKLVVNDAPQKLKELFALPNPEKLIIPRTALKYKKCEYNVQSVAGFMAENELEAETPLEVMFACIAVQLIDLGVIEPNDEGDYKEVTKVPPTINNRKLTMMRPFTKLMFVVALHALSQGQGQDQIPWYESYAAVQGSFLSQTRFKLVIDLILSSPMFQYIPKMITLNQLTSENKVLAYRLTRLSTPGLIFRALECMNQGEVLKYFNAGVLAEYRRFLDGGVLAQVASGPLSKYCVGEIDPRDAKSWSPQATLADLKPIEAPPIHNSTIIRAKMILDANGVVYGNWYQGRKAYPNADDLLFRSKVVAIVNSITQKVKDANLSTDSTLVDTSTLTESAENTEKVKQILASWKTAF